MPVQVRPNVPQMVQTAGAPLQSELERFEWRPNLSFCHCKRRSHSNGLRSASAARSHGTTLPGALPDNNGLRSACAARSFRRYPSRGLARQQAAGTDRAWALGRGVST
jgi:hypothetical protein